MLCDCLLFRDLLFVVPSPGYNTWDIGNGFVNPSTIVCDITNTLVPPPLAVPMLVVL